MQIWVDASPLGNKPYTGVENYILNLIKNLSVLDRKNCYSVYSLRIHRDNLDFGNDNFTLKEIPDLIGTRSMWYSWHIWNYVLIPVMLLKHRPDVYFSLITAIPLYCPIPSIAIVYDISSIIIPDAFYTRTQIKFRMDLQRATQKTNRIVAISQSTKDDMVRHLKADQSKISVIYPGYDNSLFYPNDDRAFRERVNRKYGINGNYILTVGTQEPRKNTKRLIEAFLKLKAAGSVKQKLVITGTKGWLYSDVERLVRDLESQKEIIFTGYADIEDLPALYMGADAFIYPSLYEGFGLPPLEAMACGTPVITSNVSSLPEVVGDAGILVDPYNVDAIADAIYRVISDDELRAEMRQKSLRRARLFSWKKCAIEMLSVIESTARGH